MLRRLLVLTWLFGMPLLVSAQQPPAAPAAKDFDADAVAQEVNAFYSDYWKAWRDRDAEGIAASLAPDFVGLFYLAPQGVMKMDKAAAVASVRQFFDAVRGKETVWSRSLLSVIPRSPREAVAAVRSDFSLVEAGGGEVELTLEVVVKGEDGRWRLLRKWTEKRAY